MGNAMKQVFTRWPAKIAMDMATARSPAWAHVSGDGVERPISTGEIRIFVLSVGLVASSALLLPLAVAGLPLAGAALLLLIAIVAMVRTASRALRHARALETELEALRRWDQVLFDRAGISLWREDWSAARDEVLRLLDTGVTDILAHYTERPDELRRLRGRVIVKDVNAFALEEMGGVDRGDLIGPLERILPDTDETFVQWLVAFSRGDRFYRSETHITRPDGSTKDTLFSAALPQDRKGFEDIVVTDFDITAYKVAQERLVQVERDLARASRVSTMGALSATIAHEVNSPLAAILSHAEAALRWLGREEPDIAEVHAALTAVLADAGRARDVVARTRAFVERSREGVRPTDLVAAARGAILMVERDLRSRGVAVHFDADDAMQEVLTDPVQFQQVLVNLLVNGAQAMSALCGPRDLKVRLRRQGPALRVSVEDRGDGLPDEDRSKVFDPFFTTREGGMGMGLAICRDIVEAQGGRIWVEEGAAGGSVFCFTVPLDG